MSLKGSTKRYETYVERGDLVRANEVAKHIKERWAVDVLKPKKEKSNG